MNRSTLCVECEPLRYRQRLLTVHVLEHLVDFSGNLRDSGPHRIGAVAMRDAHDLAHAVERLRNQKSATADCQQGDVPGFGLHPVDALLDHAADVSEDVRARASSNMRDLRSVSDLEEIRRDTDVARGQLLSTEREGVRCKAIADGERADAQRIERDVTAAAETN